MKKLRKGKIYCVQSEVVPEIKTVEDIKKLGVYVDDCCDNSDFGNHYYIINELHPMVKRGGKAS